MQMRVKLSGIEAADEPTNSITFDVRLLKLVNNNFNEILVQIELRMTFDCVKLDTTSDPMAN